MVHDLYIGKKAVELMKGGDGGNMRMVARWSGRLNLLFSLAMAFIGVLLSRGVL